MKTPPKRSRGQPRKEPTKQIRVYTADVPLLCRNGETQAEAVRRLARNAAIPAIVRLEFESGAADDGFAIPAMENIRLESVNGSPRVFAVAVVRMREPIKGQRAVAVFSGMHRLDVGDFLDAANGVWIVDGVKMCGGLSDCAWTYKLSMYRVQSLPAFLAGAKRRK